VCCGIAARCHRSALANICVQQIALLYRMPRVAKKKANDAPSSNSIHKKSTRSQSEAVDLTNETDDDKNTVTTHTPGVKFRTQLTLSQQNPSSLPTSHSRPRGSKSRVSGEPSLNQPINTPGVLILVPELEDEVPIDVRALKTHWLRMIRGPKNRMSFTIPYLKKFTMVPKAYMKIP
jgi:hypothetical protein